MLVHAHVGPAAPADGADFPVRAGSEGQVIFGQLHGAHFEAAKRGKVFIASTVVAGLAVPISTTTAPTVALWNPSSSGKLVIPISYAAAYVSGTTVAGAIGLSYAVGAGDGVSTGAIFSAFAKSTPLAARVGDVAANKAFVSVAGTNTLTAAGTWFYTMFQEFAAVAATAIAATPTVHVFDGTLMVPPGAAIWATGSAASGALLAQTLVWEEVDL